MWEWAHWLTGWCTHLRAPQHDLAPIMDTPGFTKAGDMEKPSPSDSQPTGQPLDAHSAYTGPTAWSGRVPIASGDEDETELSTEEIKKRKDFERRRKELANTSGLDIKAVLGHRLSLAPDDEDDEEDEEEIQGQSASFKGADPTAGTRTTECEHSQRMTVGDSLFNETAYAEPSRVTGEETTGACFKRPPLGIEMECQGRAKLISSTAAAWINGNHSEARSPQAWWNSQHFQERWHQGQVHKDFKDATIVHLYKQKQNRQLCDNHRGISLLNITDKIFAHIFLYRLSGHLEQRLLPERQFCFRRHRGKTDMIFAAIQLQKKCQEMQNHLYTTFVDLTKAFETVNRDGLLKVMPKFGFPERFTHMVRQLHNGMMARVTDSGTVSEAFAVTNGVKQGCVLAPILFSLMLSAMLMDAHRDEQPGLRIAYRT
ncbi:unnamed protein product [Schistocephalus solidus]|uniref:Reverse transcriptase domain-containing protein n=1 Tax=Schistocephalus solidus TaxID=70667 RepID=A0A183SVD9_SCHSO|nr:unnamed protein product [Schistocephalus solidus]